jgi:hypothetical protein
MLNPEWVPSRIHREGATKYDMRYRKSGWYTQGGDGMAEIRTAVTLAPHQKKALAKLQDGYILWGGVGSGKSRVGLAYYMLTEEHEDIYVITTAKKRDTLDWEGEAAKFGIGRERDATMAGVLTVDSWNNIEKYTNVEGAVLHLRRAATGGFGEVGQGVFEDRQEEPLDHALGHARGYLAGLYPGVHRQRLLSQPHRVQGRARHSGPFVKYFKVERYVNVQRLVRQRNQILVHMPYPRETVRHPINVWCEYDELTMARVSHGRWNVFEDKPIRDIADMFHQMRKVANSDPSRWRRCGSCWTKHPRLIIFYNFDYELAILRTLRDSEERAYAEWNGHNHEDARQRSWIYVVQYAAGAEGWNCTTTDAMCFYSLTYSYKLWEQAHGRIDRINTKYEDLYYYTLRSKAAIDWAIWRSLKVRRTSRPRIST